MYHGYCSVCGHWRLLKRLVCHGKDVVYNDADRTFSEVGESSGMSSEPDGLVILGVKYFRTSPVGWFKVDGDGNKVGDEISKEEAEAIRHGS